MAEKDLYTILGVARTAGADEIKKAYRKLARELHPDRNPDNKAAEERFKEVSAAFAVLGDPEKRKLYDEFGPDGLREGFDPEGARNYRRWAERGGFGGPHGPGGFGGPHGPGGFGDFGGFGDLNDILSSLFGGGGPARHRMRPRRGGDIEGEVTISLRQALEGTEVPLPGEGGKVRIPAGVADGQKVRVSGRGQQGPGGRGDLTLTVQVAPAPGFDREGDDLTLDLPLRIAQAIEGGPVEVPTPEGTTVKLTIPPGTQSGQRLRLRGKGMPKKGGSRGDLYVRPLIRVPTNPDPRVAELARELDEYY